MSIGGITLKIAVIGVNHNTAPASIREKVSFVDSKKIEIINYLLDYEIKEVVIVSTCNRSEIYIVDTKKDIDNKIEIVKKLYSSFAQIQLADDFLFVKKGYEAVYHLFAVTTGLKSIVLGEDQILGQVKDAHLFSMNLGASKKILNKLFREAVTTAKNIKNNLKISEYPLSISYIGVKFLKEKIGSLKGKKALIIGIGEMGKLSLKYLMEEELEKIYLTNRTCKKILEILDYYPSITPVEYDDRYSILKEVDILISATSSSHTIIKKENMLDSDRELYIMDMAMPRDVDEKVVEISNIRLYNIDDLNKVSNDNEKRRRELCNKAEAIIKKDIDEFVSWVNMSKVDPVIKTLNEQCNKIENDTLEYLYRKLDLNSRDKKIVQKMVNSALKRILRKPIINLKKIEDQIMLEEYIEVIEDLFDFGME